jgi:hypothetical protein
MGLEAKCRVVLRGRSLTAGVQLESQELIVRGGSRVVIPFAHIRAVQADGAWLRLELDDDLAAFELGEAEAARWADRIQNPKSRLDKLGAKTGQRVAVMDVDDASFLAELEQRGVRTARARAGQELDLVFFGASKRPALWRLEEMRDSIRPDGAVWVTWPKGRPELTEDDVRAEALRVGLVDVKVVAFSETLSALKLVIPLARRSAATKAAPALAAKATLKPAAKATRTLAAKPGRKLAAKPARTRAAKPARTPTAASLRSGAATGTRRSSRPVAGAKRASARRSTRSK